MQSNTFRVKKSAAGKTSIFSLIEEALKINELAGLPARFIPYILFVTAICIFYIGNNHYTEKTIRKVNALEVEVEELRADYTSLKAEYMFDSKQSEVARKAGRFGLEESLQPPTKIVIEKGEY